MFLNPAIGNGGVFLLDQALKKTIKIRSAIKQFYRFVPETF